MSSERSPPNGLRKRKRQKRFAVLLDTDKLRLSNLDRCLELHGTGVDYFFIVGSLVFMIC